MPPLQRGELDIWSVRLVHGGDREQSCQQDCQQRDQDFAGAGSKHDQPLRLTGLILDYFAGFVILQPNSRAPAFCPLRNCADWCKLAIPPYGRGLKGMKITADQLPDSLHAEQGAAASDLSDPGRQRGSASVMTAGLTAAEVQDLVENRVANLFHLSNMGHPVQLALRQLCVSRLSKKLKNSL